MPKVDTFKVLVGTSGVVCVWEGSFLRIGLLIRLEKSLRLIPSCRIGIWDLGFGKARAVRDISRFAIIFSMHP